MTGTTLMYPMIDEEAKKAGLSDVDASRFALGVSGLVSLTEGAALEWIGTIASKPITGGITKSVVQKVLKQAKNKSPLELQKLFLKEFNQSVKGNVSKVVKSASTEMGQEFSQTYIEEGSKKLYDTIYSKGKKIGDDHFGADLDFRTKKGYETFVQATFGGLIGGLIGGGMGGFHMSKGGSDIAQETMFGYINSSVKTGNFKNINKLKEASDVMLKEEKITEEDNVLIKERIDSLAEFATDTNTSGVNDGVALYQMYQLDNTRKDINKSAEGVVLSEEANPTLQKQAKQKRGKIEQVAERVQEQFDSVFDSGKPDTKNKTKFEDRLGDYKDIVQDIDENNIEQEVIDKRLDKIFDPKAKEKAQEKAQAKVDEAEMDKPKEAVDFGKSYTNADGVTLTEASLTQEAKADITAIHSKAMEAREDKEKQSEIIQEAADKYGIDKDGITAIALGRVSDLNEVSVKEEAPKEDKIAEPKKVTPEVTAQTTESLINQIETQEDLTEKDLDALQKEADEKEISSPELVDAISKRREEIVAKKEAKPTAKKTEEKPTTKPVEVEEVTKEEVVSEKTDEKTEATKEEKVTPEEQEKIDEQVAENVSAEQAKIDKIKSINRRKKLVSKEQRKRINSYDAQLIKDNPALYSEVKKHFKRIFPSIPMREVDGLGTKYGVNVLARLIESGIEIDPNKAIQTSLIHEYGHVFLETLGVNHPLVKLGHKIIKDTDFFKEAKENYPDKLEAEQLNEALTEAVAVDSLAILERRLDGAKFEQFKEWLKSLWSKLKSTIGKANQKDVTRLLARNMTLANKPFSTDISTLIGMDKNQRKSAPIPRRVSNTVDMVYENLSIQLLEYISDKDATFDFKNKRDQSLVAFSTLLEQYYDEKNNLVPSDAKIFDNVDLGIPIKEDWETLEDVRGFAKALKEKDSEIFSAADTVINSMFKSNLEVDLEEDIDDEVDQGDEIYNQGSDNAIKATKRVSLSVRSILSSIVDNAGKKVGSDAVFSYVANVAENTYKKAGLVKALENDQQNPIARRITQLISSLRKGSAEDKQKLAGFLQEISSLIQVESEGANFSITKTDKGTSYAVRNPIRNKDKTYNGLTEVLSNLIIDQLFPAYHSCLSFFLQDIQ